MTTQTVASTTPLPVDWSRTVLKGQSINYDFSFPQLDTILGFSVLSKVTTLNGEEVISTAITTGVNTLTKTFSIRFNPADFIQAPPGPYLADLFLVNSDGKSIPLLRGIWILTTTASYS
jgi:hypothetical protein